VELATKLHLPYNILLYTVFGNFRFARSRTSYNPYFWPTCLVLTS